MKIKKILLAIALTAILAATALVAASCSGAAAPPIEPGPTPGPGEGTEQPAYSVTLKRSGDDALEGVTVIAYGEDGIVAGFGTTDENGYTALDDLAEGGTYTLDFTHLPAGYEPKQTYVLSPADANPTIHMSASLITDKAIPQNVMYSLGSVMYDVELPRSSGGGTVKLSDILKTKKMVLLNFWFTNCTYCVQEFPDMAMAYSDYTDSVEVLAVDPMTNETLSMIEDFRKQSLFVSAMQEAGIFEGADGLPFTFVGTNGNATYGANANDLARRFSLTGYPTSVVVDREGVVCFIAAGAGNEGEFRKLFEKYAAEDYVQDIMWPGENITPMEKPDVAAPTSAEIEAAVNSSGYSASYYFDDDEYNWPWVVGSDADGSYITPSNSGHDNSFAIIYSDVTLSRGQAIAFDYKVSTESYDEMAVFVDGLNVRRVSGIHGWQTCYAYVPMDDKGEYTLAISFVKDEDRAVGDDKVYVKNMRVVSADDIDVLTDIPYKAAYGDLLAEQAKWSEYITPVYNAADGFWHVGEANGPLLLADLMNATNFSNSSAYSYVANGGFTYDINNDGVSEDLTSSFIRYCQYANNSSEYGLLAVTDDIQKHLFALTQRFGTPGNSEREWLELCSYYVRFGAGEDDEAIYPDPARGLAPYSAFAAVEDDPLTDALETNHVSIDRLLIPRGMWYAFTPEAGKSGVYEVGSVGNLDTYGWIFNERSEILLEADDVSFDPDDTEGSNRNFRMTMYMEAGTTYYVVCAFQDVQEQGEYDFYVKYLNASYDVWTRVTDGEYTYDFQYDSDGHIMYDTNNEPLYDYNKYLLKESIDTEVGPDGYIHEKYGDGTLGSIVYVNLNSPTAIVDRSISNLVNAHIYYCTKCGYTVNLTESGFAELDNSFMCRWCGTPKSDFALRGMFELPTPIRDAQGNVTGHTITIGTGEEAMTEFVPAYQMDGDRIVLTDYTVEIQKYLKDAADNPDDKPELHGFVPATEELVNILKDFIIAGDYSMRGVDNAWQMFCNYYRHYGPRS